MSCKFDKNLLYSYADNTIEPLEKLFVEEHLKYCDKCKDELALIKLIDTNLKFSEESFDLPARIFSISELVIDNCLAEMERENYKFGIKEYLKEATKVSKVIIEYSKANYANPYDDFIKNNVIKTAKIATEPVNKYYKKKLKKIKILKFLKVG